MNLLHYICCLGSWRSARKEPIDWGHKAPIKLKSYNGGLTTCSKELRGKEKKGGEKTQTNSWALHLHKLPSDSLYQPWDPCSHSSRTGPEAAPFCFEFQDSFMPATNLSKITFKNPQASQEFEGQALKHEGSCVVQLQFCHQLVWIIWIPSDTSLHLLGGVRALSFCSSTSGTWGGAYLQRWTHKASRYQHQILRLLICAKTSSSQIVSFFVVVFGSHFQQI